MINPDVLLVKRSIYNKTNTINRLDPNKIFDIFDQSDQQVYIENDVQGLLQDSLSVLMGISQQLVCYQILDTVYTDQQDSTYNQIRYNVKTKYFIRLYNQLITIDLDKLNNDKDKLQQQDREKCIISLQQILQYLEQIEHYEKCSVVLKYINQLKIID